MIDLQFLPYLLKGLTSGSARVAKVVASSAIDGGS